MAEQVFPPNENAPDYYVDAVRLGITPFGIVIELGMTGMTEELGSMGLVKKLATIRMSPQHALIFAKVMTKHIDAYQQKVGKIELPAELYKEMGIEPD